MKLKLDPHQTECIIIHIYTPESLLPNCPVTFVQISITPAEEVKILGVTLARSAGLLLSPQGFVVYP